MITVKTQIKASITKVWECFTSPAHIVKWNFASDDWHCPRALNNVAVGEKFNWRMEAKDGSFGFDLEGTYTQVEVNKLLAYSMPDGRNVRIEFEQVGSYTHVTESFDAEQTNPHEMQKAGWQAILDNFKSHVDWLLEKTRIKFEININASTPHVYHTMIEDNAYRKWTSVFNPGSYFKGTWEKDTKILFIGTDDQGNEGGMVAKIKENKPNEFISIEHIGLVNGNKEITSGPEVEGWAGALENYSFVDKGNSTIVKVELDANNEYKEYFSDTWPKSLEILKAICENK